MLFLIFGMLSSEFGFGINIARIREFGYTNNKG